MHLKVTVLVKDTERVHMTVKAKLDNFVTSLKSKRTIEIVIEQMSAFRGINSTNTSDISLFVGGYRPSFNTKYSCLPC